MKANVATEIQTTKTETTHIEQLTYHIFLGTGKAKEGQSGKLVGKHVQGRAVLCGKLHYCSLHTLLRVGVRCAAV
jgi:hypothetical protein